jgi:cell division protein FtsW
LLLIFNSSYRLKRWQQLFSANTGGSYHTQQLLIGIKRGGLFGVGLGNSEQKYRFIPKIATDSILAIIIEEVGIVGLGIVFGCIIFLINYLYHLSRDCPEPHLSLFAGATALWIGIQALINAGAITAVVPLTGVPFPFVSYGGSSLSILMVALGLCANISLNYRPTSHD